MDDLDKWKGQQVCLKKTISAQVMFGKHLVMTDADGWGRKKSKRVNLMEGEVFTVIGHYKGKLDLLYRPQNISEKVILHVSLSALESPINGHNISH